MSALTSAPRVGLACALLCSSGCVVEARRDPYAEPVLELADAALAQTEREYSGQSIVELAQGDEDQEARLRSARLNALSAVRRAIAEYRKQRMRGAE
jgi:hypothetical protein